LDPQARINALQAQLLAKDRLIAKQEAQLATLDAQVAEQRVLVAMAVEQNARLREQVEALTEQLGYDSRNSNQPPSSDAPGRKRRGGSNAKANRRRKRNRKRGAQDGHSGAHRTLVPEELVNEVEDVFPPRCGSCRAVLPEVPDPKAKRYQVTEVPPVVPVITEYRRHAVRCDCGYTTRVPFAESQIPTSAFGPRLRSQVALLTGVYHVSRRQTVKLLSDLCGARISLGSVSAIEDRMSRALEPAVAEAWDKVQSAKVKHTDGTSWLQTGARRALWTVASKAVTVFKIVADSSRATLRPLYGLLRGILVSDRAKALGFWAMERRQVCWAHLLRKFISFSERAGPAGRIGHDLVEYTRLLFAYWHDYKDGKLERSNFHAWMRPVCARMEALLERAAAANIARLSGSCTDILAHRSALWTFVGHAGVEPTNNHAERELRAFVLWRKRSFGTQSDRGDLYAERVMTVAHTARKQSKDILAFLTASVEAYETYMPAPSLFAADAAA
jgi:transposase